MTTGDIALLLYLAAGVRVMWLAVMLWAEWVNRSEDEWWEACVHPGRERK